MAMMQFPRELPVDAARLVAVAFGVEEVQEWLEQPGGGRRPSGAQAKHEDTGYPMWNVGVAFSTTAGEALGTAAVSIACVERPAVSMGEVVQFENLRATVWSGKSGLGGRFEADGVAMPSKVRRVAEPAASSS